MNSIMRNWSDAAMNDINTQNRIELYSKTKTTVDQTRSELYQTISYRTVSIEPYIIHYLFGHHRVHISEKIKPYTDFVKELNRVKLNRLAKWIFCNTTFNAYSDQEYARGALVEFTRFTGFLYKLSRRIQIVKNGILFLEKGYGQELNPLLKIIKRVLRLRETEAAPNISFLNLDIFPISTKDKLALRATCKKFQKFIDSSELTVF